MEYNVSSLLKEHTGAFARTTSKATSTWTARYTRSQAMLASTELLTASSSALSCAGRWWTNAAGACGP